MCRKIDNCECRKLRNLVHISPIVIDMSLNTLPLINHSLHLKNYKMELVCDPRECESSKEEPAQEGLKDSKSEPLYLAGGKKYVPSTDDSTILPTFIKFPFSRHSSKAEIRHLIKSFKPKQIYPCTYTVDLFRQGFSMKRLFGDICDSHEKSRFDQEMELLVKQSSSPVNNEKLRLFGRAITDLRIGQFTRTKRYPARFNAGHFKNSPTSSDSSDSSNSSILRKLNESAMRNSKAKHEHRALHEQNKQTEKFQELAAVEIKHHSHILAKSNCHLDSMSSEEISSLPLPRSLTSSNVSASLPSFPPAAAVPPVITRKRKPSLVRSNKIAKISKISSYNSSFPNYNLNYRMMNIAEEFASDDNGNGWFNIQLKCIKSLQ